MFSEITMMNGEATLDITSAKSQGYASDVSRHEVEGYDAVYSAPFNASALTYFSYGEGFFGVKCSENFFRVSLVFRSLL